MDRKTNQSSPYLVPWRLSREYSEYNTEAIRVR